MAGFLRDEAALVATVATSEGRVTAESSSQLGGSVVTGPSSSVVAKSLADVSFSPPSEVAFEEVATSTVEELGDTVDVGSAATSSDTSDELLLLAAGVLSREELFLLLIESPGVLEHCGDDCFGEEHSTGGDAAQHTQFFIEIFYYNYEVD